MLHFVGIGAQKAGTTWLYEMLRQHPEISFPAGKEVHYWDKHRHRGLSWYRALFDVQDGHMHGEITPAYSSLPREVVAEVANALPDLKMMLIMRNPIDRAWSAARMVLHRESRDPDEVPDEWFVGQFRDPDSLARGDYETCIRNWRSAFPDDRLLVLTFDQLAADPAGLLARCPSTPASSLAPCPRCAGSAPRYTLATRGRFVPRCVPSSGRSTRIGSGRLRATLVPTSGPGWGDGRIPHDRSHRPHNRWSSTSPADDSSSTCPSA